ncbi:RNA polymerase sigma factor [Candidatus Falkowbacteria bacterium]|nr:RNA polymerase sigma factor [Candidatus Falkowbacteria bacterium]
MDLVQEKQIVKACQAGNFEGIGLLYEAYVKKIYSFVYYKTYHKETAEDIVSDVFMKALENIGSYKSGRGSFSAWLYGIARHSVVDHFRAARPSINIEDVWDLSDDQNLEIDLDTRQKLLAVKKYLAKFKPAHREIIMMRLWGEMSYREISEIAGLSEANCKMIFSREMGKLRAEMGAATFLLFMFLNL